MPVRGVVVGMTVLALHACSEYRQPTAPTRTAEAPITPVSPPPSPPSPQPPPPSGRVQGIVLDFQSAKPIPGAIVGFTTDLSTAPIGMTETAVTDANGQYSLAQPPTAQRYRFIVDNQFVGSGYPRSTNYRADVAVDKGKCVARYGMVLDGETYAPIVGATARDLANRVRATTDKDGWYHIDWGCGVGYVGFNTTWHIMSHPDYNSSNFASGRGIAGAYREDVLLTPR